MKKMKRMMSLVSALTMLSSSVTLTASAAHIHAYSISYQTLKADTDILDGKTIPAGTVAVTMSVQKNKGFNADTMILDIENGYTILTDEEGHPLVQKKSVLSDAFIAASVNENKICITAASEQTCTLSGEMFTVYIVPNGNATTGFAEVNSTDPTLTLETSSAGILNPGGIQVTSVSIPNPNGGYDVYYYGGDCDNNNVVNAVDASLILSALSSAGTDELPVNMDTKNYYFPQAVGISQPDADGNGKIENKKKKDKNGKEIDDPEHNDAKVILQYAADKGVGKAYTGPGADVVGQPIKLS